MISNQRLVPYGVVSSLLVSWALLHAFTSRPNFYSAAVYLSGSSACVLILCNFAVFSSLCAAKSLQWILFGELRLIEVERLHERLWYTVTESLLALTIFRDEFDIPFFAWFTGLLFVKMFHWLAGDRINSMQQAPRVSWTFHLRMLATLSMLCTIDLALAFYTCEHILAHGPSVMAMFASEYIVMSCKLASMSWKYSIESIDRFAAADTEWETKSMWLFYGDIVFDFCKLVTYLSFFIFILTFYGLPLNLLRDVYITTRSFLKKCIHLKRLKAATRDMESRYANATEQELNEMNDKTCIICREEMTLEQLSGDAQHQQQENQQGQEAAAPDGMLRQDQVQDGRSRGFLNWFRLRRVLPNETPKKLSCSHVFHFNCLKSWLERQQSCPTCRQPVLENPDSQAHTRQGRPAGQQQPILANPLRNQLLRQLGIPEPPVGEGRPPAPAPNAENRPPPAPPQDGGIPRPATPTPDRQRPDQHQSDRVTERLIRSDRSTRPSPSRASSSARGHHLLPRDRSEAPSASSSAAASPTPQHSSLPDGNPFLTFSQSLPVDLEGFAPSQRTANSVKELPDGRTFKLPRVAATSLGIPPSLIIPATSASSAAPAQGPSNAAIPDGETPFDIPLSRGSPKRPPPSLSSSSPKDRQERMMASGSPRPSLLRRVASAEGQDSLVTSQQRPVLRPHSSSPDAHSRFSSRLFASRPHPLAEDTSDSRSTRETVTTPTIPADLNEEQLRTLGSLTREGLQERLNLLEGARESLEAWQTRLQRALQACDEDIPRDANTHSEDHNLSAPT